MAPGSPIFEISAPAVYEAGEILLPSSPRDGTGFEKLESGERLDEKQGWCPKGIGRGRGELRVKEKKTMRIWSPH